MKYMLIKATQLIFALAICVNDAGVKGDESKKLQFFETRIRPALTEHCYKCHSAAAEAAKGGLLLDYASGWKTGGDSGPAVIPGAPDSSLLIEALHYDGLEMPPDKKLPEATIKDFERWITDGAIDPRVSPTTEPTIAEIDIQKGHEFWAFQPPNDSSVSQVAEQPKSTIDQFINAKLRTADVSPVKKTSPGTLIRRLYLDLTGLPPTTEQFNSAFELTSNDLTAVLVEELLNSEQFGVHWGRHWLDVARYADSNGGDFNATFHNAWKYRNYVVAAMNADKPFDQFIREQVAGDLLPWSSEQQRTEQLIATGYLMIGTKMLSERDKDKLQMDVVDEQISTVGGSFLGLTLGCARCHDHKFDPIPTRDYYALAGIFRSTRTLEGESQKYVSAWKTTSLPTSPEHIAEVKSWNEKKESIQSELEQSERRLIEIQKLNAADSPFIVDDARASLVGEWRPSTLTPRYIGKGYIHDDQKDKGKKTVTLSWVPPESALYEVRLAYAPGENRANNVPVRIAHADGVTDVTVNQTKVPEHSQMFTTVGRFPFAKDEAATVIVSTTETKGYVIIDAVQFLEVDSDGRLTEKTSAEEQGSKQLATQQDIVDQLKKQLKALNNKKPKPLPQAIAASDRPQIENCNICIRGEHDNPGEQVPRGFLQVIQTNSVKPDFPHQSGRLQLAEWIANSQNPLTGRVLVNRIWSHLFGEGIVRTVDNFGKLGDQPSHPKLLDHLAARFTTPSGATTAHRSPGLGWSVKSLIREIVLSDAYQRSSSHSVHGFVTDPENRLLWKANRRRLTAEALRDSMLLISGSLDLSSGNSPVEGLGTLVKSNDADADDYVREETLRRSLYLPVIRNELPSILTIFDFADPDMVVGKRPVTNVPSQALFLMNSPFVMNCAEKTATAICHPNQPSIRKIVEDTYTKVLARLPEPREIDQAIAFLEYGNKASGLGEKKDNSAEPLQTRLTRFIHMLFASTEFRMVD